MENSYNTVIFRDIWPFYRLNLTKNSAFYMKLLDLQTSVSFRYKKWLKLPVYNLGVFIYGLYFWLNHIPWFQIHVRLPFALKKRVNIYIFERCIDSKKIIGIFWLFTLPNFTIVIEFFMSFVKCLFPGGSISYERFFYKLGERCPSIIRYWGIWLVVLINTKFFHFLGGFSVFSRI